MMQDYSDIVKNKSGSSVGMATDDRILPPSGHDVFLPDFFMFINHSSILPFDAMHAQ
jgi:hypothetical protein